MPAKSLFSVRSVFYLLIGGSGILFQCTTTNREGDKLSSIAYPEPIPDSVALKFLPGIVSSDSLDFNAAFSPDGKSFFFSRSRPPRWEILVSTYDGTQWTAPKPVSFSEKKYSEADAVFGPDGALYYISNRPRNTSDTIPDFDIWRVRQQSDGTWTTPENVEGVNSDSAEYYVSLSANGNMYFASSRLGGFGDHDIYSSQLVNGKYTAPENLGAAVNGPQMEHDPCISPDEQFLFFTSADRADSYGSGDIYYSSRTSDKEWSVARNAGSKINTDTYEYCTYVTPDGKYFFFSSDYDVKWIDTKYLNTGEPSSR